MDFFFDDLRLSVNSGVAVGEDAVNDTETDQSSVNNNLESIITSDDVEEVEDQFFPTPGRNQKSEPMNIEIESDNSFIDPVAAFQYSFDELLAKKQFALAPTDLRRILLSSNNYPSLSPSDSMVDLNPQDIMKNRLRRRQLFGR